MFDLINIDTLFSYCAWSCSAIYLIRILIGFSGAIDAESMDTEMAHASDDAFQFLSFNTLIGFFMMFGWGGLAAYRQFLLTENISMLVATLAGLVFVIMTRLVFKNAKKLTSTGTVFDVEKAVGKQGRVYQKIASNKRGVIHVIIDDFNRELDAISVDGREIESFKPVEIIRSVNNQTVVVKQVK